MEKCIKIYKIIASTICESLSIIIMETRIQIIIYVTWSETVLF